jgi:hypothetical protein
MRRAIAIIAILAGLLPATTSAAPRVPREPVVWATVNVCDTRERPNQIGIRGSMDGLARHARMYMRFRVQFQTREGAWRTLKSSPLTDSRWVRVASGRRSEQDAGWSFEFKPPATGGAHVLRGLVVFEWRRGKRIVEHARAFTEAGHPGTAGAEPADFTAATCEIA